MLGIEMVLRYSLGEEIRTSDRVLFHCHPAHSEFVAIDPNDPEQAWYVTQ
jgi:hypothetical protein